MCTLHPRSTVMLALGAALGCSGGRTPATIQQTVTMPVRVDTTLSAASCTGGTTVQVSGQLALGGLAAEIILRNNQKGTHEATEDAAASAVLVPADQTLAITAQTASGQAVADPVLSVQFPDASGTPVSAEIALGACSAGPFAFTASA